MYDKKENLKNMLEGKAYEHIPISFFQHFPREDTLGKCCIDAHIRFAEETDFDFLKIMHDGLSAPIDLGVVSLEQLKEYRPAYNRNSYVRDFLVRAEGVNERLEGRLPSYCNIFSPITLFRRIEGNIWKTFFAQNPRQVRDILMYMSEELGYLCKELLTKTGCMGIFLAMQGAEMGEFTPEEYECYIAESERYLIEIMEEYSAYNILHFCGWNGIPNQLELWRQYPGRVVNWDTHVEKLSLAEGRKYFGRRVVMGGFDNRRDGVLYSGTQAQVEEETVRIIEDYVNAFGDSSGLILGADCSYLSDFETKRFGWVTETVRKWECEHN